MLDLKEDQGLSLNGPGVCPLQSEHWLNYRQNDEALEESACSSGEG